MELEGKVAVITGAGQGIGKGIALRLAKDGANIAIVDINPETSNAVADEIKKMGRQAIFVQTDVSSSEQVKKMVEQVVKELGTIDILVNNAAFVKGGGGGFMKEAEDYWDKVIAVSLKGVILCSRYVLDVMIPKQSGRIVSISSDAARVGQQGEVVYSSTKGGILALTKSLAKEIARYGINVNCIAPGATETPAVPLVSEEIREKIVRGIPLRRIGKPEDIAGAVAFLCSSDSDYMTGQVLSVSGGYSMVG